MRAFQCILLAACCLALGITACRKREPTAPSTNPLKHPEFSVTPPIEPGPTDTFEDLATKSGMTFVQQFCDERIANIIESNGSGAAILDFDNDGDLNAFIANGDAHHLVGWESLLLENKGDGTFADAADEGGIFFRTKIRARGSVVLAFDNDGRVDVLVTAMGDRVFLPRNRAAPGNHWLTLDLQGSKSNRDGFGARINITAGGRNQYTEARCQAAFLGTSDRRVHFGLGSSKMVDKIEIKWPSGAVQTLNNVPADQILKTKEL